MVHLPQEMKRDTLSTSGKSRSHAEYTSVGRPVWVSLADTTWRVAVPTVLFAGIGIAIDLKLETMPLLTLVGMVFGLTAAGALVWRQIKAVESTEDKQ